jgi:hypothetical protein
MKNHISTQEELLILLSSNGDGAAFFILTSSELEKFYINLRHNGKTHEEATNSTLTEADMLFGTIKKSAFHGNFIEWFEKHFQGVIPESEETHFTIDTNLNADKSLFLKILQRHLLKNSTNSEKKHHKKLLSIHHNAFRIIIAIIALTGILGGAYMLLVVKDSTIRLVYLTPKNEYCLEIPPLKKIKNDTLPPISIDTISLKTDKDSIADTTKNTPVKEPEIIKPVRVPVRIPVRKPAPPIPIQSTIPTEPVPVKSQINQTEETDITETNTPELPVQQQTY